MESVIPRHITPPSQSFFLFGPRGTGKTTWLKDGYPDALVIDLLEADVFRAYSAKPERLREAALAEPRRKVVIIDEVQKAPQLLSEVHALIERKAGLQFILTGSSSRKLKRAGPDLLAGRAALCRLHPFMAAELKGEFELERALRQGLLPLVVRAADPDAVLRSYAALYLREEVQMEGLVRRIGDFSRFLEAASFSHGALLSISNIARECEVERKTVEGYVGILEDLLLAFRLPVFSRRAKRAVVAHPKFYFFDAGVYRSLRPSGPLDRPAEIEGAALEGLVAQHLSAWNDYRGGKNRLHFWRTRAGAEVDFILYGEEVFWAVEVKNAGKVRDADLDALREFKSDYPQCEAFFVYRGRERLLKNGIRCVPCDEFLKSLDPSKTAI
jgi:predicted AAA+ superfamily ATPase